MLNEKHRDGHVSVLNKRKFLLPPFTLQHATLCTCRVRTEELSQIVLILNAPQTMKGYLHNSFCCIKIVFTKILDSDYVDLNQ